MPTIPTMGAIAIPIVAPRIGGPDIGEGRLGITVIPVAPLTVDFSVVPLVPALHLPALLALAARFPIPAAVAAAVTPINSVAPVTPITPGASI